MAWIAVAGAPDVFRELSGVHREVQRLVQPRLGRGVPRGDLVLPEHPGVPRFAASALPSRPPRTTLDQLERSKLFFRQPKFGTLCGSKIKLCATNAMSYGLFQSTLLDLPGIGFPCLEGAVAVVECHRKVHVVGLVVKSEGTLGGKEEEEGEEHGGEPKMPRRSLLLPAWEFERKIFESPSIRLTEL